MTEAPAPVEIVLHLNRVEATLLQTALKFLRATLGRDEADELAVIETLLRRLGAR